MRKTTFTILAVLLLAVSCGKTPDTGTSQTEAGLPVAQEETPAVDISGKWLQNDSETIEFNKDRSFTMISSPAGEKREASGLYEQSGELLLLHFFENGSVVASTPFLTFSRHHDGYRTLYLMMQDGTFLRYTQDSQTAPEENLSAEGVYWFSHKWDENSGVWAVLDIDNRTLSIASKAADGSSSLKVLETYVDGTSLNYPGGSYSFEIFRIGDTEYLFATEGPSQSTFVKAPEGLGSFEEIFPDDDFSFLENTEAETKKFDALCGIWEDEALDLHEHGGEIHEIEVRQKLVLREDGTFSLDITERHAGETKTEQMSGRYEHRFGTLYLLVIEDGEPQKQMTEITFLRQKDGYMVLYLMNEDGSFNRFTKKHNGDPEENPLLEGVYQSSPDWQIRDGEFFMVNFNTMKAYIFTLEMPEEGELLQPNDVQDIGRDGNHAYALGMEGDFEVFRFDGKEVAFGVFSNGFHMTMWKELETPGQTQN